MGGTNVCLRKITSQTIFSSFVKYNVTHLCGAPIIMSMIINSTEEDRTNFDPKRRKIKMMTAASPPPPEILSKIIKFGIDITHV